MLYSSFEMFTTGGWFLVGGDRSAMGNIWHKWPMGQNIPLQSAAHKKHTHISPSCHSAITQAYNLTVLQSYVLRYYILLPTQILEYPMVVQSRNLTFLQYFNRTIWQSDTLTILHFAARKDSPNRTSLQSCILTILKLYNLEIKCA